VTILTSRGIRMLVFGARAVTNKGGKIVLSSPNEWVQFVLESAEIEQFIPVLFDHSAAMAAVRPPSDTRRQPGGPVASHPPDMSPEARPATVLACPQKHQSE
jgi:hypothetical protein